MKRLRVHIAAYCLCFVILWMMAACSSSQDPDLEVIVDNVPGLSDVHQFQQAQDTRKHVKTGPPASLMRDKSHIQDRDHIREHLDGYIDLDKPESEMTEKELQLHYFKLHDYDNNYKLDGLELLQAMTHYHHDGSPSAEPLKEEDLINLIDPILRDDDRNKDGFIDYPEYAATQAQ